MLIKRGSPNNTVFTSVYNYLFACLQFKFTAYRCKKVKFYMLPLWLIKC